MTSIQPMIDTFVGHHIYKKANLTKHIHGLCITGNKDRLSLKKV